MKDSKPFAFAGLLDAWHSEDGSEIRTFTIITTEPNQLLQEIHNRMPVILRADSYPAWLQEGENDSILLKSFLKPYPSEEMEAFPVSTAVNNPQNDSPECVLPIG